VLTRSRISPFNNPNCTRLHGRYPGAACCPDAAACCCCYCWLLPRCSPPAAAQNSCSSMSLAARAPNRQSGADTGHRAADTLACSIQVVHCTIGATVLPASKSLCNRGPVADPAMSWEWSKGHCAARYRQQRQPALSNPETDDAGRRCRRSCCRDRMFLRFMLLMIEGAWLRLNRVDTSYHHQQPQGAPSRQAPSR